MLNEELFILAKNGDLESKEELFRTNLRIANYIAHNFDGSHIDYDDRVSMAYVGMVKAFNSYDPTKGTKFITYAVTCMTNEIRMGMRRKRVPTVSLETCVSETSDGTMLTFTDILSNNIDLAQLVENKELCKSALSMIKYLKPKYKIVFMECTVNQRTQQEVSEMLGISRSFVNRIAGKIEFMFYRFQQTGIFSTKIRESELSDYNKWKRDDKNVRKASKL